jgi:energy-coupling factor transport system permease protein
LNMSFLENFSLGQYFPADSVIHKLDARTKLILLFSIVLSAALIVDLHVYLFLLVLLISIYFFSKLPLFQLWGNLKAFLWLFVFIFGIHLLYNPQTKAIPNFTWEGLSNGILFSLRLAIFVFGALVLSFTTPVVELTDGLFKFLSPLKKLKLPIEELSLMMMIALRFIPLLIEEAFNLKKAQAARGADFEGNLLARSKKLIPLLLPLFVSSFRKAEDLALALDARGFRSGAKRSSFRINKFGVMDYLFLISALLVLAISWCINKF